jgi:hypothetical protein
MIARSTRVNSNTEGAAMKVHKSEDGSGPDSRGGGDSMMGMMAVMMAMCLGIILLFAVIPTVGLPLGLLIAVGAGALMLVLHARFMRHR